MGHRLCLCCRTELRYGCAGRRLGFAAGATVAFAVHRESGEAGDLTCPVQRRMELSSDGTWFTKISKTYLMWVPTLSCPRHIRPTGARGDGRQQVSCTQTKHHQHVRALSAHSRYLRVRCDDGASEPGGHPGPRRGLDLPSADWNGVRHRYRSVLGQSSVLPDHRHRPRHPGQLDVAHSGHPTHSAPHHRPSCRLRVLLRHRPQHSGQSMVRPVDCSSHRK
ncbi:hypothetical protein L226DRAFT_208867 [Lentinus tigrinus ALCF2SS1-7]|uniref:uncharacterized protein n=1 Tax=Lentinus tigrinus ALCF2SS1-7 TaxID=1328758 RepID=UPI001165FB72|nr:hypothetical protein L226DRAFT_208867 [Lentinus tigrinus ALCF2SS1-7]